MLDSSMVYAGALWSSVCHKSKFSPAYRPYCSVSKDLDEIPVWSPRLGHQMQVG